MAKKKRKEKRKKPKDAHAALYHEDLGSEGIKQQYVDSTKEESNFRVKVNSAEKRRRLDRMERFANPEAQGTTTSSKAKSSFERLSQPLSSGRHPTVAANKTGRKQKGILVGLSENLEKPYLRLTTYPKPEDVRPLHVLRRALEHAKTKYAEEEDFEWTNEQMKSIRQDLTVQSVRDPFVLTVYETHARILLENGDLNEFNQCQTMLRSLTGGQSAEATQEDQSLSYVQESTHSSDFLEQTPVAADEFLAYGILYSIVRNSWALLKLDLVRAKKITEAGGSCSQHALFVLKALNEYNYSAFFRLYNTAPKMSPYLMDFLLKRVRDQAYERMITAYRPNISIEYVQTCLGFADEEEAKLYLVQMNASFIRENGKPPRLVNCKQSMAERCG